MATTIQIRRDSSTNWQTVNPILANGEFGKETDTGKIKNGDGVTAWNDLEYTGGEGGMKVFSSLEEALSSDVKDGEIISINLLANILNIADARMCKHNGLINWISGDKFIKGFSIPLNNVCNLTKTINLAFRNGTSIICIQLNPQSPNIIKYTTWLSHIEGMYPNKTLDKELLISEDILYLELLGYNNFPCELYYIQQDTIKITINNQETGLTDVELDLVEKVRQLNIVAETKKAITTLYLYLSGEYIKIEPIYTVIPLLDLSEGYWRSAWANGTSTGSFDKVKFIEFANAQAVCARLSNNLFTRSWNYEMYGIIKSGSFDLSKPYPIDASVKFTLVGDMENKYGKYEVTLYSSNNHSNYYYEINFTLLDYPATKSYVDSLILTTLNTEV